jgi:hypothetical protein
MLLRGFFGRGYTLEGQVKFRKLFNLMSLRRRDSRLRLVVADLSISYHGIDESAHMLSHRKLAD